MAVSSTTTTTTSGTAVAATTKNNNNTTTSSSTTLLRNRHKILVSSSTHQEVKGQVNGSNSNTNTHKIPSATRRRVRGGGGGSSSSILPMYNNNNNNNTMKYYYSKAALLTILMIVGSSIAMICGIFRYYDTLKYYQSKTKSSMGTATEFTAAYVNAKSTVDDGLQQQLDHNNNNNKKAVSRMMMVSKEGEEAEEKHNQQERKPPIIPEKKKKKNVEVYHPSKHNNMDGQQQQQQQLLLQPKKKKEVVYNPIVPNNKDGIYDIAILGAGPAGLSAAIFGSRAGLSVIVLGSQSGLLSETTMLNNFPSYLDFDLKEEDHGGDKGNNGGNDIASSSSGGGPKWLQLTKHQALSFGANFAPPGILALDIIQKPQETMTGNNNATESSNNNVFVLPTQQQQSDNNYKAYSIIIATGANPRRLNLHNEDKLWSKQIHNCAICDGNIYLDKTVLVIGGGDAAIDAALLLSRYAKSVKLVHRSTTFPRVKNQLSIDLIHQSSNIQIITPYVVDEWKTETTTTTTSSSSSSSSLVLTGAKLKRVDNNSNNNNEKDSTNDNNNKNLNKFITLDCDGAFLMIGATPNTEWLSSSSLQQTATPIALDDEGFIKLQSSSSSSTATTMATSLDGVFAAGEVTDKIYRQAITASSQGAQAAMDAERWLRQYKPRNIGIRPSNNKGVTKEKTRLAEAAAVGKQDIKGGVERIEVPAVKNDKKQGTAEAKTDAGNENCDDLTQPDCITKLVQSHPVVVFSKPWCQYCRKALETLSLAGVVDPYVVDLSKYGRTTNDIQATLQQMTGRRTVPNVFINGKSIGGGDETVALHRDGKLIPLLREAGAIATTTTTTTTEEGEDSNKNDKGMENKVTEKKIMEKKQDEIGNNNNDGLCDLTMKECMIQLTKQYPVLLFTLRGCPECTQMYELLDLLNLEIQPFKIDLRDQSREAYANMRQSLREMAGSQSVPSLFVGGESLGGFKKTNHLHQQGLLIPKFVQVGAIKDTKQNNEDKDDSDNDEICDLTTKECIIQLTKKHPVLLFTLRGCPECTQMFELLDLLNLEIPPYKIDLKDHPGEPYMNMRTSLLEMAGSQSVPSLFVGGESLGGFQKTNKLHQQGLLIPKFMKVGAIKE